MTFELKLLNADPFVITTDNDISAFIPQLWASEGLMILVENMVAGSLVYRDFEPYVAKFGDIVNTRRPADFTAKRKVVADNVIVQDAIAVNVQVPLDQHIHTSFIIKDGEESRSFKDLVQEFLYPAIVAQARLLDQIILGQYVQFLGNGQGQLANLTANNARTGILSVRQKMNINKAPLQDRYFVVNPLSETTFLSLDLFLQAQQVGDSGQALQNAIIGRKLGFDFYMEQNMPAVLPGNTTAGDTVANSAGYPAGTTVFLVTTGTAGNFPAGAWLTVAGDMTPQQIVSFNSGTKAVTVTPGFQTSVANLAAVNIYSPGAVNNSGGYAIGYSKEITINGFTVAPQVGQFVTFTGDPTSYSIINVNGVIGITLDRPLVNALTNTQGVNLGPAGNYNLAFHKNAIALVCRPLSPPKAGTGALSAVVNWNDLSMRTTITYDGNKQGHLVTVDMLCGIAVLDKRLGAVLLG